MELRPLENAGVSKLSRAEWTTRWTIAQAIDLTDTLEWSAPRARPASATLLEGGEARNHIGDRVRPPGMGPCRRWRRGLRATGVVTAEMDRVTITIADVEAEVGLDLVKFPNGGSWSFFLCSHCGQRARTLKLFEGCVLCWRCCHRRGMRYRCWPAGVRRRAEMRIPKLRAMLESPTPLRLKPVLLWSRLERRSRLKAALARAEYLLAEYTMKGR
jgi:hypothetical protein